MAKGPLALGVQEGVQLLLLMVQQFFGSKAVEAKEPVGLVEPVFPEKRGLEAHRRGKIFVVGDRDIGGEKAPSQLVFPVQPLGET